jgi:hypothetical protein
VADLEPEAVLPHRQRIGGVEDDLAAHVAQGADRRFGAVPRRRQHDDVGRRRRFRSRAGPRLAAERAHKCLHLFGLRIAHAEENLMAAFCAQAVPRVPPTLPAPMMASFI